MSNPSVAAPKRRKKGCRWEAIARGKVFTFRWDPELQVLSVKQKHTRREPLLVSGDDLADAAEGQSVLFRMDAKPVATPVEAVPAPKKDELLAERTPDMFAR